jgi:hypothetical protein
MMRSLISAILGLALLLFCGCATPSTSPGDQAGDVLRAAKAASGGAAWDRLAGSFERGSHSGIPYQTWVDFRQYGMRVESQRGDIPVAQGYDGQVAWRKMGDRTMTISDAGALSEARISAYVSNNAYFFPDRFTASFVYLGTKSQGHRAFEVIEAQPEGARAVRLWFDRRTHLLAKIDDFAGTPAVIVNLSDYRRIGPVLIAHYGTITDAAGMILETNEVTNTILQDNAPEIFAPPAPVPSP